MHDKPASKQSIPSGGSSLVEFTNHSFIWLYFMYGLAFFTTGISALQQKLRHGSEFPLMRWIHLLGIFGVFYGTAEWISMIRLMHVYPEAHQFLYLVQTQIHGFSFAVLFSFAVALLETNRTRHLNLHIWLPWMIFVLWTFFYLGRYYSVPIDYNTHILLFDRIAWFLLGLPGALLAGTAYYLNGRKMGRIKLSRYARMYNLGGALFIVLALTTSVLAVASSQLVRQYMGMVRVISAIGIAIITVKLFDSFLWEMQERLNKFAQRQLLLQERRKTIRMVHDQIIQRLFGAGMFIENMMDNDPAMHQEGLETLKEELNQTIKVARSFLKDFSETGMVMEDFQENVQNLVGRLRTNTGLQVAFEYHVPPMVLGKLAPATNSQLYFILQEALLNVQKHAKASSVTVGVHSNLQELIIQVSDNGVGMLVPGEETEGFGIQTMKERARDINATISFNRRNGITSVMIIVPWEEHLHGE